jgi:hypothetical protein
MPAGSAGSAEPMRTPDFPHGTVVAGFCYGGALAPRGSLARPLPPPPERAGSLRSRAVKRLDHDRSKRGSQFVRPSSSFLKDWSDFLASPRTTMVFGR